MMQTMMASGKYFFQHSPQSRPVSRFGVDAFDQSDRGRLTWNYENYNRNMRTVRTELRSDAQHIHSSCEGCKKDVSIKWMETN